MRLRPAAKARTAAAILPLLLALAWPTLIWAHAVVHPARSLPGAFERYLLRVPNEREIPTERVEIRFPANIRVVSFGDVPGWTLEVERSGEGAITSAVWTGTLPAERFVEFPFVAVNPPSEMTLSWPVIQTYAGGEAVEWVGPEDSSAPASSTLVEDAAAVAGRASLYLGGVAVVLALLALGLAVRRPQPHLG